MYKSNTNTIIKVRSKLVCTKRRKWERQSGETRLCHCTHGISCVTVNVSYDSTGTYKAYDEWNCPDKHFRHTEVPEMIVSRLYEIVSRPGSHLTGLHRSSRCLIATVPWRSTTTPTATLCPTQGDVLLLRLSLCEGDLGRSLSCSGSNSKHFFNLD